MSATFPLADLVVRLVADMSQFSREMVRAETLLKKKASAFTQLERQGAATFNVIAKSVSGFGNVLATAMTAGLGATAALIGGLAAFSVWASKVATGADELRNRFKITFGTEAPRARAELNAFADNVGRSRLELMDMAATLQNVFTAMGFSIDQAASMSITIARLGTDIASFHDIADQDAVDRLSSALVGNHEALRSLGIVVTETAVKQKLLEMGFKGGFDAATDQQKMLARLAIIVHHTSLMHDDAAETAGSMANQYKGLWGVIKDLADEWGQALIPAMKIIVSALREMLLGVRNNITGFEGLSTMLAGWATNFVGIMQEVIFAIANYDLSWEALVLTVQHATSGITTTVTKWLAFMFAGFTWLSQNVPIVWNNIWGNALKNFQLFAADFAINFKGLVDFIRTGGEQFAISTKNWSQLGKNVTKDMKPFIAPEIDDTDWQKKFGDLEDKMNKRREDLKKGVSVPIAPFAAPDLQGLFDQISGNMKAEIKVNLADTADAWRENLLDAFKDSDSKMQTQLQKQIEANQQKQMVADKQNNDELKKALTYTGGGFY